MKLATLKNHTRDGQWVVVSHDLLRAVLVPDIEMFNVNQHTIVGAIHQTVVTVKEC